MKIFKKVRLLCYLLLFIFGCEEDDIDIEGCMDSDALNYNRAATISDESCENDPMTYAMPSFIFNSSLKVAIFNSVSYNEINITNLPLNINWLSDTTLMSYGIDVDYEVLHYPYTCEFDHDHPLNDHIIKVSNHTYLFKENLTDNIFKLHFEDYNSGIVLFKYAKLNGGNQSDIDVITSNFYNKLFYYNLITSSEDTINWHISFQKLIVEYNQ